MKIYHTETQADYDALMVELGIKGIGTLGKRYWEVYENQTVVIVHALCRHSESTRTDTAYGSLEWALKNYLTAPQKYKAKADEKMRFTKENVLNLTDKWIENKGVSFQDLQNEIKELDDTPEKVVVPKYVAEWIEWNKETGADLQIMFKAYRHYYDNIKSYSEGIYGKEAVQWYIDNPYKFIQAYEDGYNIEKEQLYHVLNTEGHFLLRKYNDEVCGMRLSAAVTPKDIGSADWFLLTEREIKNYDERFWAFAVPVEE